MRGFLLVVFALAWAAPSQAQSARPALLYEASPWRVERFTSDLGNPMCVLEASLPDAGSRHLWLKYATGGQHVIIQSIKDSWDIPDGISVPVRMVFDNSPPWNGQGRAFDRRALGWSVTVEEWRLHYANFFANGRVLRIGYLEGDEPEWRLPLSGSTAALGAFHGCVRGIGSNIEPVAIQ